jgi:hypothetical protein
VPWDWPQQLLAGYAPDIVGVGGTVLSSTSAWYLAEFLTRNNPHGPLSPVVPSPSLRVPGTGSRLGRILFLGMALAMWVTRQ